MTQKPKGLHRVIFNASGTNLTAAVLPKAAMTAIMQRVNLNGLIVDHKFYVIVAKSNAEANYLAAILNSPFVDAAIKPYQTMGAFGERDIHRRALEYVPIPEFDSSDGTHQKLAVLGAQSADRAQAVLPKLGGLRIGQRRMGVRAALKDLLREIDTLVKTLPGMASKKKVEELEIVKGQAALPFKE